MKAIVYILILSCFCYAETQLDTFGIVKFYPAKAATREWNSAHWNNGISRTFSYASDPYDPTGWTEDHSGGTDGFRIDGNGIMQMSGTGPRFHINSLIDNKVPAQKYRDIEFTAYYRRHGTDGASWGGMVVGLRSGPLGHGSPGGDNCDATTYYARFRNDGKWDFEKELKHPGSDYWSGSGFHKQDPLWNEAPLPLNRWIGMKFLVYNIMNNTQVKLELYIDSVSNGDPQDGVCWEKVGEVIDSGAWPSGDVSGCNYPDNMVITEGGGTALMRTDNDTADYKMVSIREIDVSGITGIKQFHISNTRAKRFRVLNQGTSLYLKFFNPLRKTVPYAITDIRGHRLISGNFSSGSCNALIRLHCRGVCLLRIGTSSDIMVEKVMIIQDGI